MVLDKEDLQAIAELISISENHIMSRIKELSDKNMQVINESCNILLNEIREVQKIKIDIKNLYNKFFALTLAFKEQQKEIDKLKSV